MLLLPEPLPPGLEDMSLLYLLISRTMSKKALSTLTRVLADVSMNLQPNPRASAAPSVYLLANGLIVKSTAHARATCNAWRARGRTF